ncbi:nucleotidyl transferase AbiEii/AbiGii toxin family protein [Ravibacter arvi]
MKADEFSAFRLVGGTSLSLQLGHRMSVDIDLFSDISYGKIDFNAIDEFIEKTFPFSSHFGNLTPSFGKSYMIGIHKDDAIKLDIFYTDPFIQPVLIVDDIRFATIEEIIAMKIDVIQRGGRKKDFWDLHELLNRVSIDIMLELHKQRYAYGHDKEVILQNFTDFHRADDDFEPICLRGKYWEFIKEDIEDAISSYKRGLGGN